MNTNEILKIKKTEKQKQKACRKEQKTYSQEGAIKEGVIKKQGN